MSLSHAGRTTPTVIWCQDIYVLKFLVWSLALILCYFGKIMALTAENFR